MKIGKEFYFDAAHHLPHHQGKCKNLHGHTYKLEVVVEDKVKKDGMVIDFAVLKTVVQSEVLEKLDHQELNSVMDNPTAENIVSWIVERLQDKLPLHSIKLWEGEGKWVEMVL
ncbi:MAG: 6-carboxytetrahydropterin synthase QueD [Methanobacteriota archaeon]